MKGSLGIYRVGAEGGKKLRWTVGPYLLSQVGTHMSLSMVMVSFKVTTDYSSNHAPRGDQAQSSGQASGQRAWSSFQSGSSP